MDLKEEVSPTFSHGTDSVRSSPKADVDALPTVEEIQDVGSESPVGHSSVTKRNWSIYQTWSPLISFTDDNETIPRSHCNGISLDW